MTTSGTRSSTEAVERTIRAVNKANADFDKWRAHYGARERYICQLFLPETDEEGGSSLSTDSHRTVFVVVESQDGQERFLPEFGTIVKIQVDTTFRLKRNQADNISEAQLTPISKNLLTIIRRAEQLARQAVFDEQEYDIHQHRDANDDPGTWMDAYIEAIYYDLAPLFDDPTAPPEDRISPEAMYSNIVTAGCELAPRLSEHHDPEDISDDETDGHLDRIANWVRQHVSVIHAPEDQQAESSSSWHGQHVEHPAQCAYKRRKTVFRACVPIPTRRSAVSRNYPLLNGIHTVLDCGDHPDQNRALHSYDEAQRISPLFECKLSWEDDASRGSMSTFDTERWHQAYDFDGDGDETGWVLASFEPNEKQENPSIDFIESIIKIKKYLKSRPREKLRLFEGELWESSTYVRFESSDGVCSFIDRGHSLPTVSTVAKATTNVEAERFFIRGKPIQWARYTCFGFG